jgi:cation-transporting P-type ATPase 13A2
VIALAYKNLDSFDEKIDRDYAESSLHFLGLLIFINKLKPETTQAIKDLQEANIKTIMATGDHGLTAISVAKKCNIISNENPVYFGDLIVD